VAAGAEWTLRATSGPPAAGQHALVYDAARQKVLTVGGIGRVGGDTFHPGTWAWDGLTWEQIATGGPSPRFSYAIAYDEHRKVVVLHGGLDSGFHLLGDTWEWNGATWEQITTSGPSPREGARMCYDRARRKMILFGGRTAGQFPAETWSWDGQTWVVESTTGPAGRRYYGLCYDSRRDVVVMVGGQSEPPGYIYGDTWEWNGEVWQQVATTGPEATDGIHLAYDEARGVSVMFRGHDATLPSYIHAETWEWDGVSWASRTLPMPSPRAHYGMAYDSDRHVVVLFGGGDAVAEGRLSDTWEYGDIDCDGNLVPDSCETDSDSDGIVDNCDNCAATGNPRQEDFDHDGQGDSCDPDMDNDGVVNEYDVCNYTPPGAVVITDPESCLRGTLRCDADGDCDVDLMDFAAFERELTPPN
jgi:hypothetical protein